MPIRAQCRSCQYVLKTRDELAGRKVKCPECGEVVVLPGNDEADDDVRDEAPARRRKKKKKSKSARSNGLLVPLLAGGGILLVIAVVVAVMVFKGRATSREQAQNPPPGKIDQGQSGGNKQSEADASKVVQEELAKLARLPSVRSDIPQIAKDPKNLGAELAKMIEQTTASDPNWRLADLDANRKLIPSNQNGALLVALADERSGKDELPDVNLAAAPHRLDPAKIDAVRNWLRSQAVAVALARKLGDFPNGRFRVPYELNTLETKLPHLQGVRRMCVVIALDATLKAHDGDGEGALRSAWSAVHVARSIGDEPHAISQLVRVACDSVAIYGLERALACKSPAPESTLASVQKLLEKETRHPFLETSLRGERASYHFLFTALAEGNLKIDKIPYPGAQMHALYLERINAAIAVAGKPTHEQVGLAKEFGNQIDRGPRFLGYMLPQLTKLTTACVRGQSLLRSGVAAVAAERFRLQNKDWPANLQALVPKYLPEVPLDPFTGNPLMLKKQPEGLVIYSVGPDGRDDGGRFDAVNTAPSGEAPDYGFRLLDPSRR